MSKVYTDTTMLNSEVMTPLRDTIMHVNNAVTKNSSINVPSDFSLRTSFFNYEQEISKIKTDLTNLYAYLNEATSKVKDCENIRYNQASFLPNNRVIVRKTIIK